MGTGEREQMVMAAVKKLKLTITVIGIVSVFFVVVVVAVVVHHLLLCLCQKMAMHANSPLLFQNTILQRRNQEAGNECSSSKGIRLLLSPRKSF